MSSKEIYKTSSGRRRKRSRIQRRMTSKGMTATRIAMRMRARIVARMRINTRIGTTVRLPTRYWSEVDLPITICKV